MADDMNERTRERDPSDYTVKEILTMFVLPELKAVRSEMDTRLGPLETFRNRVAGVAKVSAAACVIGATLAAAAIPHFL